MYDCRHCMIYIYIMNYNDMLYIYIYILHHITSLIWIQLRTHSRSQMFGTLKKLAFIKPLPAPAGNVSSVTGH